MEGVGAGKKDRSGRKLKSCVRRKCDTKRTGRRKVTNGMKHNLRKGRHERQDGWKQGRNKHKCKKE